MLKCVKLLENCKAKVRAILSLLHVSPRVVSLAKVLETVEFYWRNLVNIQIIAPLFRGFYKLLLRLPTALWACWVRRKLFSIIVYYLLFSRYTIFYWFLYYPAARSFATQKTHPKTCAVLETRQFSSQRKEGALFRRATLRVGRSLQRRENTATSYCGLSLPPSDKDSNRLGRQGGGGVLDGEDIASFSPLDAVWL